MQSDHNFHSVYGGMIADYFVVYCKECNSNIDCLDYYGIDSVGVRLRTKCNTCGLVSVFKLKVYPMLGPIERSDEYDERKYKLFDKRKLKGYLNKIRKY